MIAKPLYWSCQLAWIVVKLYNTSEWKRKFVYKDALRILPFIVWQMS